MDPIFGTFREMSLGLRPGPAFQRDEEPLCGVFGILTSVRYGGWLGGFLGSWWTGSLALFSAIHSATPRRSPA